MTETDNIGGRTTHITSPFRQGDFVVHEGESYQVIEFVGCSAEGLVYRGRGTEDMGVVMDITLPVVAKNDHNHELSGEEDEVHFQVMELSKDDVANLKPWSREGPEKKMKVRWEEDVEMIRDGLTREDKEVFCTVGKIMGKEVLGNIKILPKDPPIMKMPDLVMDMIFSNLSPEDRLQCRLVTPGWAFEVLPINRFVACCFLSLERDGSILVDFMPNPRSRCAKDIEYCNQSVSLNNLEPLINNWLLENVTLLYVNFDVKSRPEEDLQIILDQCRNVENFEFSNEPESADTNWTWAKKFISTNAKQLESLSIDANIREVDFADDLHIGELTSLDSLTISLSRKNSILRNFESLPCSITSLALEDLSVPLTKPQILWIAAHLNQLSYIRLDVLHHHAGYFFYWLEENQDVHDDDNELDENTMVEMMNRLPCLRHMKLTLNTSSGHDPHGFCDKAKRLKSRLHETRYHQKWWNSRLDFSSEDGPHREEVVTVTSYINDT